MNKSAPLPGKLPACQPKLGTNMTDNTDWNSNLGGGFRTRQEADEFFHCTGKPVDSLTETCFWNFHVPEAAINCYAYCR
jgi:hypothetical protein